MMQHQHQDVFLLLHPQQQHPHGSAILEIKRRLPLPAYQPLRLRFSLLGRQVAQIMQEKTRVSERVNDLDRSRLGGGKGGSQHFVTAHDFLKATLQRLQVQRSLQTHPKGNMIGCIARLQLVQNHSRCCAKESGSRSCLTGL